MEPALVSQILQNVTSYTILAYLKVEGPTPPDSVIDEPAKHASQPHSCAEDDISKALPNAALT
jgi:hypothetical protein